MFGIKRLIGFLKVSTIRIKEIIDIIKIIITFKKLIFFCFFIFLDCLSAELDLKTFGVIFSFSFL